MNYALLPIDYLISIVVDGEEVFTASSTQAFPALSVGSKIWARSFGEPSWRNSNQQIDHSDDGYVIIEDVHHAIDQDRDGRHLFSTTIVAHDPAND